MLCSPGPKHLREWMVGLREGVGIFLPCREGVLLEFVPSHPSDLGVAHPVHGHLQEEGRLEEDPLMVLVDIQNYPIEDHHFTGLTE